MGEGGETAARPQHLGDGFESVRFPGAAPPSVIRRLVERFVLPEARPAERERLSRLTEREREVPALVARGLSNADIAARLFLGETTVKTHLGRLLSELGLRDRVHAVIFAYESGLVRVGA